MFLDNLIHNASCDVNKSLNSLSIDIKQNYDVDISKQGLNERYTLEASLYLRSVLGQCCFASDVSIDEGWLGCFNSVRIKDSTKFVLPEEYAHVMPGFSGVSSKSAACIQYEYDLKTGSIHDMNITPANRTDSRDARETQDDIHPNDLVIRDLGYYSNDVLSKFREAGAFIISKLYPNTLVYEKASNIYKLVEFGKLHRWMKKNKVQQLDKQVYIGSEVKMPIRLIITTVPDEVFAKRMQKVNKYNKRMGHKTSDAYADRARFNLFITNIPCATMPAQAILALYHVRWQIELIFKIWKSTFGIHKIGKMKYYRWLCILYTKLILIAIFWQTIMPTRAALYKIKGKLLSIDKCFKTLKTETSKLRNSIRKGKQAMDQLMGDIIDLISEKHWLERKKKKLNFEQILYLYYCKSNIYVYF